MANSPQDPSAQPNREYPGMGTYPGMGSYPGMGVPEEGLSLQEIFQSLWRKRITIVVTTLFVTLAALAFTLSQAPTYEAEARILLEEASPSGGILGELSMLSGAPPAAAELEVIQSRELANRLVAQASQDTMGLGLTLQVSDLGRHGTLPLFLSHFGGNRASSGALHAELSAGQAALAGGTYLVRFLSNDLVEISADNFFRDNAQQFKLQEGLAVTYGAQSFLLVPDGDLTNREFLLQFSSKRAAAEQLLKNLSVSETARGSGVLRIAYEDSDPNRAAAVVNGIVQAYLESKSQRLAKRAKKAAEYLATETEKMELELEEAEEQLVQCRERSDLPMLTETARAIVGRISELELARAQLSFVIENQAFLVRGLDNGELIENIATSTELSPQMVESLSELSSLNLQAALLAEDHTENWPPLIQIRAQLVALRGQISKGVRAQAAALNRQSITLGKAITSWTSRLDRLPADEQELAKFVRKAESLEQIYTYLLAEQHKARLAAENQAVASVSIVDRAIPATSRSSPNITLNVSAALLLGAFLGAALALWRDASQKTILSAAQLESVTGLPQWGIIPDFRKGGTKVKLASGQKHFLALREAPDSPAAESYRALRANLKFAAKGQDIKTLTITSSTQGEGKSTTIADLAIALANGGARVLLIDADLRRPVVHSMFDCPLSPGLAEVLLGDEEWRQTAHTADGTANMEVITAGVVNKGLNPGDLLALDSVSKLVADMREAYDFVLFDVPPVLAVADAASFLSQLDAILLLCRYDTIPEMALSGAARRLTLAGAEPVGAVLNRVVSRGSSRKNREYSYYHYDSTS